MRAGTTPTFIFKVPIDIEIIENIKITFFQNENIVLEKYLEDCEIIDGKFFLDLTQEESFKFDQEKKAEIQMRVVTIQGDVLASDIKTIGIKKCLDKELLV
jgi:hypothetical protein